MATVVGHGDGEADGPTEPLPSGHDEAHRDHDVGVLGVEVAVSELVGQGEDLPAKGHVGAASRTLPAPFSRGLAPRLG